jgi:hypothetical protein
MWRMGIYRLHFPGDVPQAFCMGPMGMWIKMYIVEIYRCPRFHASYKIAVAVRYYFRGSQSPGTKAVFLPYRNRNINTLPQIRFPGLPVMLKEYLHAKIRQISFQINHK